MTPADPRERGDVLCVHDVEISFDFCKKNYSMALILQKIMIQLLID